MYQNQGTPVENKTLKAFIGRANARQKKKLLATPSLTRFALEGQKGHFLCVCYVKP